MPLASRRHPTSSRLPRHTPLRSSHARLSTRQGASAFNQPLSFDTSSVTNMDRMFMVRSARALASPSLSRAILVHAACVVATQRPPASRAAPLYPHCMPAFRLGSTRRRSTSRSASTRPRSRTCAGCSSCAPRVPWPPHSLESGPPRARRMRRRHPTPSRLPGRTSSAHRMPAFRLGSTRRRSTSRSVSTRPRSTT